MVIKRPTNGYQALIGLIAALMTLSLLSSLSGFWRLELPFVQLMLYSVAATAFAWISWRVPWLATALAAAGLAVATIGARYLHAWTRSVLLLASEGQDFLVSLHQHQLAASFGPAIGTVFVAAAGVGAALLILREVLARGNTFWSIAGGAIVFGTQWSWYYDKSADYFASYAVLAFTLWTLGQAARRDASWESTGRKIGYRSHVVTPLAWVLAVAVLATVLPSSFAPVDLGLLGERAQEAFPVLKQLRGSGVGGGGRFTLATTGFSPSMGALGGPVKVDRTVALHLTADRPLTSTTYLRGATFLTYVGQAWQSDALEYTKVPPNSTLPSSLGSNVLREYAIVKLSPAVNLGNTLFGMLEPMRVEGLKSDYRADQDGNLWAEKAPAKGASYQLTARVPTYSADQIRALSNAAAGDAYKPYLQVSDTLPKRVADLSREITAGQTHPYDKAIAMEAWLRGLPYDLNVPASPQGRDFIDYFLFDLKRGYCTYYSTAMAVMLRELGIPTRLVEGFALPPAAQYTEGSDGKVTYAVLNAQAHAWVEAYFPAYGWVTFDPTPRSDLPLIDRSTPAPSSDVSTSSGETAPTDPAGDPRVPRNPLEDPQSAEGGTASAAPVRQQLPWALLSLLLAAGLLYFGYRRLQSQDQIRSSEDRQVVQEAWQKTSSLMSRFDFGRKPHQTAREYADSLSARWPSLREPATHVAEDYTVARFAPPDRPVDPEAAARARGLWEKVHEALFRQYGWRTYLWRRLRRQKQSGD